MSISHSSEPATPVSLIVAQPFGSSVNRSGSPSRSDRKANSPLSEGHAEVCALAHHDTTTDDPRWECVDIRYHSEIPKPVTLADVKANPMLEKMSLVTSMRLSVQPVTPDEWQEVCRMAGLAKAP